MLQRFESCLRLINKGTTEHELQTLKIRHYENYNDY